MYNCLLCRKKPLNVNTNTPTTALADSYGSSVKQSWRHYYMPLLSAEILRFARVKWLSAELRRAIIIIIVITAGFSLELTCLLGFSPSTLYKQFFWVVMLQREKTKTAKVWCHFHDISMTPNLLSFPISESKTVKSNYLVYLMSGILI